VLATGLTASAWDVRTRRVPNAITLGSAAIAVAFHALDVGGDRVGLMRAGWSASGWVIGLALFFPVFMLRGLGAGDVKLLAAMGAWLGPAGACWAALYTSLAGGAIALPLLVLRRALGGTLVNLWGLIEFWRRAGVGPHPELTLETSAGLRLPYAVPISIGALLTLWWRT